ncbi:MAG TPA: SDR family oxidoreductase [Armatimonadota bacterium]|jgi:dTDP-4-dehydrorhamnose reductase
MCELLVTGASGFLGAHIMRLCAEQGRDAVGIVHSHQMPVPGRTIELNLADNRRLMELIRELKPGAVIHAGALTSPDYCEAHREEADAVNFTATGAIAMAAFAVNAHLLFVSTDLVFDGEAGMYTEADAPSPLNHYARTKAQAEHIVRSACPDFAVVRPSFIYGRPMAEHHGSYSETLYRNLREGIPTPVFTDQYRSPIEAGVLAAAILEVSDERLSGIWHVAGPERVNRAQFARLLADIAGLDPGLLRETSMDDVVLPAARPRDVSLDISKARQRLKTSLPGTKASLEALYHAAA